MPFSSESNSSLRIPETAPVLRLDLWLVEKFPDRSRSEIQNWIRTGLVSVPGLKLRPGSILPPGTELKISPPEASRSALPGPEDLP
ncbi:MAG: S4 domain-containing protein, partial [Kiritimatiellia bacterium]